MKAPIKDLELKRIGKEASSLIDTLPEKITTPQQYESLSKRLIDSDLKLRKLNWIFDKAEDGIKAELKEVKKVRVTLLRAATDYVQRLKDLTAVYFSTQEQAVAIENKKKMDKYAVKVDQAVTSGKEPESVKLPHLFAVPSARVAGDSGELYVRHLTRWRLTKYREVTSQLLAAKPEGQAMRIFRTDARFADLPDSCWELNNAQVMAVAKTGHPAVELFTVPTTVVVGQRNGNDEGAA